MNDGKLIREFSEISRIVLEVNDLFKYNGFMSKNLALPGHTYLIDPDSLFYTGSKRIYFSINKMRLDITDRLVYQTKERVVVHPGEYLMIFNQVYLHPKLAHMASEFNTKNRDCNFNLHESKILSDRSYPVFSVTAAPVKF